MGPVEGQGRNRKFMQGLVAEILRRATSGVPPGAAKGERFSLPTALPGRGAEGCNRLPLRLGSLEIGILVAPCATSSRGVLGTAPLPGFRVSSVPVLANSYMVPVIDQEPPNVASSANTPVLASNDVIRGDLSDRADPTALHSSHLTVVDECLKRGGYEGDARKVILKQHARGSVKQYQHAWKLFLEFMQHRDIPHESVRLCTVVNFQAD